VSAPQSSAGGGEVADRWSWIIDTERFSERRTTTGSRILHLVREGADRINVCGQYLCRQLRAVDKAGDARVTAMDFNNRAVDEVGAVDRQSERSSAYYSARWGDAAKRRGRIIDRKI